ncbi:MAG: FeoB-associated Cys-rich membrane protein [Pseudomonadota bacterium]
MWQEIIVGICVLGAAYFVLRQWLPVGKKSSTSCGGCGTAKSCSNPAEKGTH